MAMTRRPAEAVVVGGVMLWFVLCRYALPYRLLRRAQRRGPPGTADGDPGAGEDVT
ncbi:hypothetical protein [Streptomyces sp. SS]|uniref:hypothetical protein n=1 Tax=Streptomyces sp. SS TaxID=260742 RepID=UPI0002D444CF|nr:hypothetical protein [Streptomyces sp. SS]